MNERQEVSKDRWLKIVIPEEIISWFVLQNAKKGVDIILWIEEPRISYEQAVAEREQYIKDFGIQGYEHLLIKILWQSKIKMSFSDFREFKGVSSNFRCCFWETGNWFFDLYKKKEHYQNFVKKYPELNEQITSIYRGKEMTCFIKHTNSCSKIQASV